MLSHRNVARFALSLLVLALAIPFIGWLGCAPAPEPEEARLLRLSFPEQAARVLDTSDAFSESTEGFALDAAGDHQRDGLSARLPLTGGSPVRFTLPSGFVADVREIGVAGAGQLAGSAVAYPRAGGTSYWTATSDGYEEWLHLRPEAVALDRASAAWSVEGATLRQADDAVELLDGQGNAVVRVTAPAAYRAGGEAVQVRLEVKGSRIELYADADNEELLVDPSWTTTGAMTKPRNTFWLIPLNTGKVLAVGLGVAQPQSELYDPALGTWESTLPMVLGRNNFAPVALANDKVLVTGGSTGAAVTAACEIYDPVTNAWTPVASMNVSRKYHTATLLNDGRVLVVAGHASEGGPPTLTAELYDPVANTWTSTPSIGSNRITHRAVLLQDGRVFVALGAGAGTASEIYDPVTNTWSFAAPSATGRYGHEIALLPSGKVLVFGGFHAPNALASAELYDPVTNTWSATGAMHDPRHNFAATSLADGTVLAVGGHNDQLGSNLVNFLSSADIYDPVTGLWTLAPPMSVARAHHAATRIASGQALVAGGLVCCGVGQLSSAELYGMGAVGAGCAQASDCSSGYCVDGVCCDTACAAGACDACSIAAGAASDGTCALLTGASCDDADACTQTDSCMAGVCTGASPVACAPMDECHSAGACDPPTGMCSNPQQLDGTPCTGGKCVAGVCTAATGAGGGGGEGGGGGSAATGGGAPGVGGAGGDTTNGDGGDGDDRDPEIDSGCGCGVSGSRAAGGLWVAFAAVLLARRRRLVERRPR